MTFRTKGKLKPLSNTKYLGGKDAGIILNSRHFKSNILGQCMNYSNRTFLNYIAEGGR